MSGVSVRGLCVSVRELCVSVRGVVKVSVSLRRGVSISVCERVVSEEDCVCDVGFSVCIYSSSSTVTYPILCTFLEVVCSVEVENLLNNNV